VKNCVNQREVRRKIIAETSYVINVDLDVVDVLKGAFHNFLGDARGLTNSNRQTTIPIYPAMIHKFLLSSIKEIIKIRSRQQHTSQCDGPAWLMS
jgi:hypothetical protein